MSEGLYDDTEPALRNLWGLAPFGQKFDDVSEPTPTEYFRGLWNWIKEDPEQAITELVEDFFAIGR